MQFEKGNLFQQKTQAKCIDAGNPGYATDVFHYIHQNAWKSKLVEKMEDWEFSSFPGYAGLRNDTLCDYTLAKKILMIDFETFYEDSYKVIEERDWEG